MAYGDLNTFGGLTDFAGEYTGGYVSDLPGFGGDSGTSSSSVQSAVMQSVGSLGGLLSDLTKWDTARRLSTVSAQGVAIASRQNPMNTDATTRAASAVGGVRIGDLLPFVVVGGLLWFVMRKA